METVAMVAPSTYQMHSQVLGFLDTWKHAQHSCNEISVVKWQHVYRKTVSLVMAIAMLTAQWTFCFCEV